MDVGQLSAITNVQRLREIVAEKVVELPQRDVCIVETVGFLGLANQV